MRADTVEPAVRRAVIEARLPNRLWPDRELRIPAINAQTGELRVFGNADGVELIDAVGASCAVPGVWPVVVIEGERYMDGGMASGSNVHLAADCDVVVVLSPAADPAPNLLGGSLREEIDVMAPLPVLPVFADDAVVEAIGTNSLSPTTRRPRSRTRPRTGSSNRRRDRRVSGDGMSAARIAVVVRPEQSPEDLVRHARYADEVRYRRGSGCGKTASSAEE